MFRPWPIPFHNRHGLIPVRVASPGTVSQLAGRVQDFGAIYLLVRTRLVVSGVTTRTIRLECRVTPTDDFRIGLVAFGTPQVAAVIERLVWQAAVPVIHGRPCIGHVAESAVLRRVEMARILARGLHAVVTGGTRAQYLAVVNRRHRRPDCRVVAVLTDIGRLHVRRALTDCVRAVVAVHTIAGDAAVIEIGRYPGDRRVAIVAVIATGNMRCILAGRSIAIVARRTGTDDLRVIDRIGRHPGIRFVAILTDIRCLDVSRGFAGCIRAIVTVDAITRNVDVIEIRGDPRRRRVAILAVVTAGYVCRCLAGGDGAIVAGTACTDNLVVIHAVGGSEYVRRVAILTDIRGLDVSRVLARCIGTVVT